MVDHRDKKAILTRRRRFLVATLAGAGVAAVGGCDPEPQVCLQPPPDGWSPGDAGPDGDAGDEPQVCLKIDPDAQPPGDD